MLRSILFSALIGIGSTTYPRRFSFQPLDTPWTEPPPATGADALQIFDYAKHGKAIELKTLLNNNVNLKANPESIDKIRDEYGRTPLMMAAYAGEYDTVKMLYYFGSDANAISNDGKSVLHWALWDDKSGLELIQFLVEEGGADPFAAEADGDTPIILAYNNIHPEAIQIWKYLQNRPLPADRKLK